LLNGITQSPVGLPTPLVFPGFSISTVPEPSAMALGLAAIAVWLAAQTGRHRRKSQA